MIERSEDGTIFWEGYWFRGERHRDPKDGPAVIERDAAGNLLREEYWVNPPDLPAAFAHFVVHHLRGRSLDDNKDEEAKLGKFPDFACYRDLVLIEMKHLETDQNERINETYKSRVPADEVPFYYGKRRLDLNQFSNGREIASAIISKLARTLETHLGKANDQVEDYRKRNPRKNSVSICLLLNSQIDEFSPDVVIYAVQQKLRQPSAAGLRFLDIDAVLYISEKHAQELPDGRIAFAIAQIVCAPAIEQRWKTGVIERVMQRWSEFRTGGAAVSGRPDGFESVVDVPPQLPRHEAWKLAYRRNPYLRPMTDRQLMVHFHRCVGFSTLLSNGSWSMPSMEEHLGYVRSFGDAIEEINHRGIDLRCAGFSACAFSACAGTPRHARNSVLALRRVPRRCAKPLALAPRDCGDGGLSQAA